MKHVLKIILLIACLSLLPAAQTFAGPPFLTDDPEPVEFQHWEAYIFANGDHSGGGYTINGPALELNYGILPETQLHLILPATTVGGQGVPTVSGLGDTEIGVKYRFVHDTNGWPQIGIFPMVELPSGDANRGLGNGQAWFRLPVWLQKDFGEWKTYGGGGIALNPAPGQRDFPFGGWLLQRDITEHLSLGGEVFAQGSTTATDKAFAAINLGGTYKFNDNFSCLFSAGRSVAGAQHTLWYFGLYWTW